MYLEHTLAGEQNRVKNFLKLDIWSYALLLLYILFQISWKALGAPAFWLRAAVLFLLLFKSLILFRALYILPRLIQPVLLVSLSMGLYLLSYPFLHLPLSFSFADIFEQPQLFQIGVITVKSFVLSVMMLEMFLLSISMTKSRQSAFFAWIILAFTFPVIGFPQMSSILAGLLIIFILRMIVSRLNTRELVLGLLEPASITIGLKFFLILALLGVSGLIYWSNVKPDFEIQWMRALNAALRTLFDGQFGLLCYAPLYWLALFGITYLLFFQVWDGVFLIVIGTLFYTAYHLAFYGILEKITGHADIVPFVPFLGVFIAVAHHRFGKIEMFRVCVRLLAVATAGITALLLLLYSDLSSIGTKMAEIQRQIMISLNKDLSSFFPSMIFRPHSLSLLLWGGGMFVAAFYCCQIRTKVGYPQIKRIRRMLTTRFHIQRLALYPLLLCIFLLIGNFFIASGWQYHTVSLETPIQLSEQTPRHKISLERTQFSQLAMRGILLVSNLTSSTDIPHHTALARIIINDQQEDFETFSLKAGKDTTEVILEEDTIKNSVAHGRSAIYRSRPSKSASGTFFESHEYYTRLNFKKPVHVRNISMKLLIPKNFDLPSDFSFHIEEISLLE